MVEVEREESKCPTEFRNFMLGALCSFRHIFEGPKGRPLEGFILNYCFSFGILVVSLTCCAEKNINAYVSHYN